MLEIETTEKAIILMNQPFCLYGGFAPWTPMGLPSAEFIYLSMSSRSPFRCSQFGFTFKGYRRWNFHLRAVSFQL